jgi:hypothetical protein
MTDQQELRRLAKRLQLEIGKHGAVTVYLDDTGAPRVVPGYAPRLVGVYEQGVGRDEIADDLEAALADRP